MFHAIVKNENDLNTFLLKNEKVTVISPVTNIAQTCDVTHEVHGQCQNANSPQQKIFRHYSQDRRHMRQRSIDGEPVRKTRLI